MPLIDPSDHRRPFPTPEEGRFGFWVGAAVVALVGLTVWWLAG